MVQSLPSWNFLDAAHRITDEIGNEEFIPRQRSIAVLGRALLALP
jgi:hypothetical protein